MTCDRMRARVVGWVLFERALRMSGGGVWILFVERTMEMLNRQAENVNQEI